jgi:hypothetical protein
MEFKLEPYYRNIDSHDLIDDMRRVAREIENTALTTKDYAEFGKFSVRTIQKRFGSWKTALAEAGLKQIRNWDVSEIEYFENVEKVWRKLGRQPRYEDMKLPISSFHPRSYDKRFGSWRNALQLFVEYVNKEESGEFEPQEQLKIISEKPSKGKREPSWRLRFVVMRRDNFKCRLCGRSPANDPSVVLHIDHVVAWANGGATVADNLQTLCSICNIGKSNLPMG